MKVGVNLKETIKRFFIETNPYRQTDLASDATFFWTFTSKQTVPHLDNILPCVHFTILYI